MVAGIICGESIKVGIRAFLSADPGKYPADYAAQKERIAVLEFLMARI